MSDARDPKAVCPVCKRVGLEIEACENDHGDYTATVCTCGWRSDTPKPGVARTDLLGEYCEHCSLPIRAGELYLRYGDDIVVHCDCPKVAQA